MISFHKNSFGQEEKDAIARVLDSGKVAHGVEAHTFEREFADYVGVKYAIFTNSCTSALKIAFKYYLEKMSGHTIFSPRNTFCATYSAAREIGLDVEYYGPEIMGVKPGRVNVHFAGIKDKSRCLVEDSAHRIEANDPLVGKIRCYSFHGTKSMSTGHGGMFVTNDKDIYEYARLVNNDGIKRKDNGDKATWDYTVELMSGGYDGSDINAAIGREQLKKLPVFTKRRNEILALYNRLLGTDWQGNLFYVHFVDQLEDVGRLIAHLKEAGIEASYHYPGTGWLGVSLPIYPSLTDNEVEEVCRAVKTFR